MMVIQNSIFSIFRHAMARQKLRKMKCIDSFFAVAERNTHKITEERLAMITNACGSLPATMSTGAMVTLLGGGRGRCERKHVALQGEVAKVASAWLPTTGLYGRKSNTSGGSLCLHVIFSVLSLRPFCYR